MTKKEATNAAFGINHLCRDNYFREGHVHAEVVAVKPRVWGVEVSNGNNNFARTATEPFEAFGLINEVARGGMA